MERQLAPSAQWHMAAISHEHSLRSGRLTDGESISPSVGWAGRQVLQFVFYSPEKLALARATFAYVLFMWLHIIILFNL